MGRKPKLNREEIKDTLITMKVTKDQKNKYSLAASQKNLKISAYIRQLIEADINKQNEGVK